MGIGASGRSVPYPSLAVTTAVPPPYRPDSGSRNQRQVVSDGKGRPRLGLRECKTQGMMISQRQSCIRRRLSTGHCHQANSRVNLNCCGERFHSHQAWSISHPKEA